VLTLVAGAFSVSLPFLKVGVLGCVAMDVDPSYQTALGGIGSGCLSAIFCLGPFGTGGFSEMVP
jgi:hypothetical protein